MSIKEIKFIIENVAEILSGKIIIEQVIKQLRNFK